MDEEEEVQYVKLISADGHEFILDRAIAVAHSKTIATMLEGSFLEARENVIRFPEMAAYILERFVKYVHYKTMHSNSSSRIPDFVSCAFAHRMPRNVTAEFHIPVRTRRDERKIDPPHLPNHFALLVLDYRA